MKAFRVWLLLIIAALFFGCKTTRTVVKTSSETEKREQLAVTAKAAETTSTIKTITYEEQSESSDKLEETIIEETFSAPDSTGKQYLTARRTTDRKRAQAGTTIGRLNTNDEVQSNINESTEAELKTETAINQEAKETVKTVTKTPPILPLLVIAAIGLILAYVNRKKILKWICTRLLKK